MNEGYLSGRLSQGGSASFSPCVTGRGSLELRPVEIFTTPGGQSFSWGHLESLQCFSCLLSQWKPAFSTHSVALRENYQSPERPEWWQFLMSVHAAMRAFLLMALADLMFKGWLPEKRGCDTSLCLLLSVKPAQSTTSFTLYWPHRLLPYSHAWGGISSADGIPCGGYFIGRKVKDFL